MPVRPLSNIGYWDLSNYILFLLFLVVVLCASANSVREIMIKAAELNFVNGEYVFLNFDLFTQ